MAEEEVMFKKLGLNSISDVGNWIVTLSNTINRASGGALKEKIPGFLGLSLADEQIFAAKLSKLTKEEQKTIIDFLSVCKDFEKNRFRCVIAGIPPDNVKEKGKDSETRDNAVEFLKSLARVIEENGIEEARKQLIAGNIIVENPIHQRVLNTLSKEWKIFKDLLAMFKSTSLAEVKAKIENKQFVQNFDQWAAGEGNLQQIMQQRKTARRNGIYHSIMKRILG